MSDEQNNVTNPLDDSVPFSQQSTSMVETTLAETLGLSMHNAITNQQSAQMTTSASITNACARLLQTPTYLPSTQAQKSTAPLQLPPVSETEIEDVELEEKDEPQEVTQKKRFNLFKFLGKKPKEPPANE
jgi:hypothetical protein